MNARQPISLRNIIHERAKARERHLTLAVARLGFVFHKVPDLPAGTVVYLFKIALFVKPHHDQVAGFAPEGHNPALRGFDLNVAARTFAVVSGM